MLWLQNLTERTIKCPLFPPNNDCCDHIGHWDTGSGKSLLISPARNGYRLINEQYNCRFAPGHIPFSGLCINRIACHSKVLLDHTYHFPNHGHHHGSTLLGSAALLCHLNTDIDDWIKINHNVHRRATATSASVCMWRQEMAALNLFVERKRAGRGLGII